MTEWTREVAGRQRTVAIVFGIVAVLAVAAGVSDALELHLLHRLTSGGAYTHAEAKANDDRQSVIAAAQLAGFIGAAIAFIRWLRSAYRAVDRVAPAARRFTHGWAIGAWFVPILNLWRPKKIVNDVWRAGRPGDGLPAWLNAWWVLFLLNGALGEVSNRLANGAADAETLQASTAVAILDDVAALTAAVLTVVVAGRLTAALEARARSAPQDTPAAPPRPAPPGWLPPVPGG